MAVDDRRLVGAAAWFYAFLGLQRWGAADRHDDQIVPIGDDVNMSFGSAGSGRDRDVMDQRPQSQCGAVVFGVVGARQDAPETLQTLGEAVGEANLDVSFSHIVFPLVARDGR